MTFSTSSDSASPPIQALLTAALALSGGAVFLWPQVLVECAGAGSLGLPLWGTCFGLALVRGKQSRFLGQAFFGCLLFLATLCLGAGLYLRGPAADYWGGWLGTGASGLLGKWFGPEVVRAAFPWFALVTLLAFMWKRPLLSRWGWGLLGTLFLALGLRWIGAGWGNGWGHIDEVYYFIRTDKLLGGNWGYDTAEHPPGAILIFYGACRLYQWLSGYAPGHLDNQFLSRATNGFLGMLTVFVVAWTGRVYYSRKAGLWAGLFLALVPVHVMNSHYVAFDVPVLFWMSLCNLLMFWVLTRQSWTAYLLTGLVAGIAIGTKYTGLFEVGPILAAHFLSRTRVEGRPDVFRLTVLDLIKATFSPKLWALAGAMGAGFVVAFPFLLLDWDKYTALIRRDFAQAVSMAESTPFIHFAGLPPAYWYHIERNLPIGLGWGIFLCGALGMLLVLWKHREEDILFLCTFIPIYLNIGRFQARYVRYSLVFVPAMCILAGWFLSGDWSRWKPAWFRRGMMTLGAFVAAGTFLYSVAHVQLLYYPDIRDVALHWFNRHCPPGSRVGLMVNPAGLIISDKPHIDHARFQVYRSDSLSEMLDMNVQYLVCADTDFYDILRLDALKDPARFGFFGHRLKEAPAIRKLLANQSHLKVWKTFETHPEVLGIDFTPSNPMQDWRYPCPTILLFKDDGAPDLMAITGGAP